MALERVPADIRAQGGVARMSDLPGKRSAQFHRFLSIFRQVKARFGICQCQLCHRHLASGAFGLPTLYFRGGFVVISLRQFQSNLYLVDFLLGDVALSPIQINDCQVIRPACCNQGI